MEVVSRSTQLEYRVDDNRMGIPINALLIYFLEAWLRIIII
jgi:hypothetical protein